MKDFTLKLAQLDLARQMETPEFIREFFRMLAASGYNGVLLYLEDRVITASYPYPKPGEAYTETEIRELVAYAATLHLEVIPCVATLGHAERFLRHPELAHLAELPDGEKGRFGGTAKLTFCISNPELYPFLEKYLTEVAALFPAGYFHIGLDEFWDYNLCPRCHKRMPDRQAEERCFLEHVNRIAGVVRKSGKRPMMWSDMFEYYPEIFPELPEDMILCDWQYRSDVRTYSGHLLDMGFEDRLAANRANGFATILAPNDSVPSAPRSYLEMAKGRQEEYLGFMLTSWEKTDTFLYRWFPIFAYTGYLLQGKDDEAAWQAAMVQLFGSDDAILHQAVRLALNSNLGRHFTSISEERLFTRELLGLPYPEMERERSARELLALSAGKATTETGRRICADLAAAMEERRISNALKKLYHAAFDRGLQPEEKRQAEKLIADFGRYLDTMIARWNEWRPGITPDHFAEKRDALMQKLDQQLQAVKKDAFIEIRGLVPDGCGVAFLDLALHFQDHWVTLPVGVPKPVKEMEQNWFDRFLSCPLGEHGELPDAVRLEVSGLGGMGIAWVALRHGGEVRFPAAVTASTGNVHDGSFVLENDVKFAWFGEQSIRNVYFDLPISRRKHTLTITMQPIKPGKRLALPQQF